MTREELNNKIHSKIVNDELYEDEMMEDIMQLVDAHVKEQLRIGGVMPRISYFIDKLGRDYEPGYDDILTDIKEDGSIMFYVIDIDYNRVELSIAKYVA